MSGRSAYVRKEKTKVKDGDKAPSVAEIPLPRQLELYDPPEQPYRHNSEIATIKSVGSGDRSDDLAYARVRKPHVPVIDVSGIEKSSFRSMMDKKSESVRKGIVKTFGKKKKSGEEGDERPSTSATTYGGEPHELDSSDHLPPPPGLSKALLQQFNEPEHIRAGPPQAKLPPLPPGPQLRRWVGDGRPSQLWNRLRKDPELWDPRGDTYVYFGLGTPQSPRPAPSFRVSSHAIEATESMFLISLLHEGCVEDVNSFRLPPSPESSPRMRTIRPARQGSQQHTPPMSEAGTYDGNDGQILYEIYFPAPLGRPKIDTLRHQVTTRNVFALLYQASLVGLNIHQALTDLHERLESWFPQEMDIAGMLMDYVASKGFDDVRNNPSQAAGMLAWSEGAAIRWEEGWKEAFVHCVGMYDRLDTTIEFKRITPITRALLERASLEVQVRIQNAENRFLDFDFRDMWIPNVPQNSTARVAFDRFQVFLLQYYRNTYESWPPVPPYGQEQWLTRNLTQKLQADFSAMYDYFVDRDIVWDGSSDRNGRKWNLGRPGDKSFESDTKDCPFNDIITAFDNANQWPHIPHPYPLTPDPTLKRADSVENLQRMKRPTKPQDKMAERKAALAYSESTNIYLLGSDYAGNDLVDAFVKFEKSDRAGDNDPHAARRGRWILVYGVLQTLASVAVDTPHMRYGDGVSYHLNPRLRGTPPWKGANHNVEEASHIGSHTWLVRATWNQPENPPTLTGRRVPRSIRSSEQSYASSDAGSSIRSPSTLTTSTTPATNMRTKPRRHPGHHQNDFNQPNNLSLAHEKVDQWPIKEEIPENMNMSFPMRKKSKEYFIRDFDEFQTRS